MSSHSIKALDLLCMCVRVPQEPPRILKFNYQKVTTQAEAFLPCSFSWVCVRWVRPTVMFREGPPSCQRRRRRVWGSRAKCEAVLCGGGTSRKRLDPLGDAELSGLPCLCRWRGCWETWLTAAAGLRTALRLKSRLQDSVQKGNKFKNSAAVLGCSWTTEGVCWVLAAKFVYLRNQAKKWLSKRANNNLPFITVM